MLLTTARSDDVRARIQADVEGALRRLNLSARRASLDVVGNDGLVRDIRAGRLPGIDRLEALYEYLGLEFRFGPSRTVAVPDGRDYAPSPVPRTDYVPIPWHEAMPHATTACGPVALSRDWLAEGWLDPATLVAVRTDTCEIALVEARAARSGGPAAWACREARRIFIASVQFEGAITLILPADREDPVRVQGPDSPGRVTMLGRVAWVGRTIPD